MPTATIEGMFFDRSPSFFAKTILSHIFHLPCCIAIAKKIKIMNIPSYILIPASHKVPDCCGSNSSSIEHHSMELFLPQPQQHCHIQKKGEAEQKLRNNRDECNDVTPSCPIRRSATTYLPISDLRKKQQEKLPKRRNTLPPDVFPSLPQRSPEKCISHAPRCPYRQRSTKSLMLQHRQSNSTAARRESSLPQLQKAH